MITLRQFMEVIDYKITEGSEYCWDCYGPNAYQMDSWNGLHDAGGYTVNCVFDKVDQTVYQMEAWDYTKNRVFRWIHPNYLAAYKQECVEREIDFKNAFDDTNFTDIDVEDDIIEKATAIVAGEEYDTRVQVPLVLDQDHLYEMMKLAHQRDITLNELVESVLTEAIAEYERTGTIRTEA